MMALLADVPAVVENCVHVEPLSKNLRKCNCSGEFDRFDCRAHPFFYYSGKSSKEV